MGRKKDAQALEALAYEEALRSLILMLRDDSLPPKVRAEVIRVAIQYLRDVGADFSVGVASELKELVDSLAEGNA